MQGKENDSICISKLVWVQFKQNRISFSFKGLPQSIHFTIAWNKEKGKINLHITKNTGEGSNKPTIIIANFDDAFLNDLSSFLPSVIFHAIFQPITFKRYSRKSRKNIKIIFLDTLNEGRHKHFLEAEFENVWNKNSETKRRQFKIKDNFASGLSPLAKSSTLRAIVENDIRNLTSRSFDSHYFRSGIIFMGKKSMPFISVHGKCYRMKGRKSLYDFLLSFTKPDFAKAFLDYIKEALQVLTEAQTYTDTLPYNRPYQLLIEKTG